MRILELCVIESLGGLELYFEKCSNWFHHSPHYSLAVVLEGSRLEQRLQAAGAQTASLPTSAKSSSLANAFRLARLIEEHRIEVVHMHHNDNLMMAALAKVVCKQKFKLVMTRQMHMPHSKKDLWHTFLYKKIDLYIVITEQLRLDVLQRTPLPEHAVKLLYYGVKAPVAFSDLTCAEVFGNNPQQQRSFKVGIFSRIDVLKGQHLVVEAARQLQKKYPALEYYFFGDVMKQEYKERLVATIASYGLSGIMHFKGFHASPTSVMPCFDVIILPSSNETFGLVLPEAMRAGVAVIGTNAGGVKEIIDHKQTGLLFEQDNHEDLATQLETLYQNEDLRRELAHKGNEKADREFNEERHFQQLDKMLTGLL